MALAQVVYRISTDADFAALMRTDPEGALEERGWRLSKEELSFLLAGLFRKSQSEDLVSLKVAKAFRWW
ncbi:MAG: hypothetical protein HGA28_07705 [Anaerolineaceae bacterium]|nr:hypothetical protein [Anaerolineaceae bacterium]